VVRRLMAVVRSVVAVVRLLVAVVRHRRAGLYPSGYLRRAAPFSEGVDATAM
jgi:hypothetical protein